MTVMIRNAWDLNCFIFFLLAEGSVSPHVCFETSAHIYCTGLQAFLKRYLEKYK